MKRIWESETQKMSIFEKAITVEQTTSMKGKAYGKGENHKIIGNIDANS